MNKSSFWDIRLFLLASGLITSILLAYVASEFFVKRSEVTSELRAVAVHTADRLSTQLVSSLWSIDELMIYTSLKGEMKRYELASIQILDSENKNVLFEEKRSSSSWTGALASDQTLSESRLITTEAGEDIGTVKVSISGAFLQQKLVATLQRMGLQILLLWAALILAFIFITKQLVLKPVRKISGVVRAIEQGNLSERLEVRHNNEIGELARAVTTLQRKMQMSSNG